MNLFTLHSQTNKNNIFIYGHWIRSTYDTMLLTVAIFPNSFMMCILSTGWMRTKSHTARVVKRSMFLLLFLYLTTTFQISPSLLNSISWTIPYWYVFTTEPSFLVNKKTLQIFMFRSLRNHFGCSINFGTCDISHVSNHTLKIFLFTQVPLDDSQQLSLGKLEFFCYFFQVSIGWVWLIPCFRSRLQYFQVPKVSHW